MISGYERRLARMFDVVMHLDALRLEDAAKISFDIIRNEKEALTIAELGDGVPFYIESISLTRLRCEDPYEAFSEELRRGALNELFTSLFDDMPPAAREVVLVLAKGPMSFEGLEKEIIDDTLPYALDYLIEMDIIGRIERKRRVTYYIKDKTFGAWATMTKKGYTLSEIRNIKRILSLGFESIIRELFLNINKEIEIEDANNRNFIFGPTDYVKRFDIDGEVDLFAMDKKGRTVIGEITIRESSGIKLLQLLKNAEKIKQKFRIEKAILVLVVYKKPKEEILEKAIENNIYILSSEELNKLARTLGFRPI